MLAAIARLTDHQRLEIAKDYKNGVKMLFYALQATPLT